MKRALGAVVAWETFQEMTQAKTQAEEQQILMNARKEEAKADRKAEQAQEAEAAVEKAHVATYAHLSALPHSHEDEKGHDATQGTEERKEHTMPEDVKH
jgi:predicted negative regulator of RcsB-dependent stress response